MHDAFLAKPFNLDDLLMQIAELLKITLVVNADTGGDRVTSPGLAPSDRARLIESARLGHVAGVRDHLARLRAKGGCDTDMLERIGAQLNQFNMGGVIKLLEAEENAID